MMSALETYCLGCSRSVFSTATARTPRTLGSPSRVRMPASGSSRNGPISKFLFTQERLLGRCLVVWRSVRRYAMLPAAKLGQVFPGDRVGDSGGTLEASNLYISGA